MIQAPKGTKDVLPQESHLWQWVEGVMRKEAAIAGYREIRTPVFEHTELFQRGVGDTTDIVQKEMYTFLDKGERSITLKPEGTAGVVRSVIEHNLYADALPVKVFYLNAPIFRYEKPQSGRLREHHQFGMECFGAKEPSAEAELIATLLGILGKLGLKDLSVHVNSIGCPVCRPTYHGHLRSFLEGHRKELCNACQDRLERNPLRVLDCKEETCKRIVADAPVMMDHLCEECDTHFSTLKELLNRQQISFKVDTHIVRGLDYYTKTVFEIIMQSGREGLALCGGGRYDGLVEQLGGPSLQGVGFGIGTERILMELNNQGIQVPGPSTTEVFIAQITPEDKIDAFILMQRLRAKGIQAECDHVGRSLKAQFKFANKMNVGHLIMVGGDEKLRGMVKLRNMQTREESEMTQDAVVDYFSNNRKVGE